VCDNVHKSAPCTNESRRDRSNGNPPTHFSAPTAVSLRPVSPLDHSTHGTVSHASFPFVLITRWRAPAPFATVGCSGAGACAAAAAAAAAAVFRLARNACTPPQPSMNCLHLNATGPPTTERNHSCRTRQQYTCGRCHVFNTDVQLPVNVLLFCRAARAFGESEKKKKKLAAERRFSANGASAGGCMGNSRQLE